MSAKDIEAEICVLGGGPAGAVFALKLARLGHDVLLLERERFPRPHVGEALGPGAWDVLGAFDLLPWFDPRAALACRDSEQRWRDARPRIIVSPGPGASLVVDRGRFDAGILAAARAAGVRVLQPATAETVLYAPAGAEIRIRTAAGSRRVLARYVGDASGRRRVSRGTRELVGARTLALHARWARPEGAPARMRIEARPDGWLWAAPLPDATLRVMAFCAPGFLRTHAAGPRGVRAAMRAMLASSRLARRLGGLAPLDEPAVCDASAWRASEPIHATRVLLGEAGYALDPLSSSGVKSAMQTAWSAAIAVHTLRARPADARVACAYFTNLQAEVVGRHRRWAAESYAEQRMFRDRPFWSERSRPVEPAAHAPRMPSPLPRDTRVRLSARATLQPTPSVLGDLVALAPALAHPGLDRPVAFIQDRPVSTLLDGIASPSTPSLVAQRWGRTVGIDAAWRTLGWWWSVGVLERDS